MVLLSPETHMQNIMDLGNTRDPRQREIMEQQLCKDICHFCREEFEKRHSKPIHYETGLWFVTENSWPYGHAPHHYLIIPKRHIVFLREMTVVEKLSLFEIIQWIEDTFGLPGHTLLARTGDMRYTGATYAHLHFHVICGDKKPQGELKADSNILTLVGYKE